MNKKIIFIVVLALVFVVSSMVFANTYVNPEKMGMVVGLGALVIGYFGSKAARNLANLAK